MPGSVADPLFLVGFLIVVVFLLALDLGVLHRKAHVVGFREALLWSIVWVVLSLSFGTYVYFKFGPTKGLEFFAGYLIEYALSVDNIFVFILLFSYFAVPPRLHHRVLFWGIIGALIMRATFLFAGAALLEMFHWIIYVFGGFLVFTGYEDPAAGKPKSTPNAIRWYVCSSGLFLW